MAKKKRMCMNCTHGEYRLFFLKKFEKAACHVTGTTVDYNGRCDQWQRMKTRSKRRAEQLRLFYTGSVTGKVVAHWDDFEVDADYNKNTGGGEGNPNEV